MPAFSFDTIQTAADVLTVANRLSRFTQEITAHNLQGGLDKFKSEHKSEQETASKRGNEYIATQEIIGHKTNSHYQYLMS